ncbi:MAG: amidase [Bacteroidota bacterium]
MSKFIYKSATELARLIKDGNATSTEIVKEHLDRIKEVNPQIDAIIDFFEQEALAEAKKCDKEAKHGEFRGPLHGVPMTIKEQFWIKGTKSTTNFKMMKDWVAPSDAIVVKRLKDAGVVIMGKTNVPRNLTDYQVSGDIYPDGKNPYNPDHSPGGSSGGTSAAIASGMTPIGLGGDFGGSIRNPSNFCGLYGIKPTDDMVPGHGSVPVPANAKGFVFHMAQPGPLARTPEDLEVLMKTIRGPAKRDRTSPRMAWKNPDQNSLSDFKIGWVDNWPGYEPSDSTKSVIKNFIDLLSKNKCSTENAAPANNLHERSLSLFVRLFGQLIGQDSPWVVKQLIKMNLKKGLLKGLKKFKRELNGGFSDSFIFYSESMGIRAQVIGEWEQYFEKFDLLVCPTSFGPAFKRCKIGTPITHDGKKLIYVNYVWPYLACFNASGHPAMNIPLGIDKDGLPVGVQVVGPYWSEPVLLHFAKLVSKITEGFIKPEGY